MTARSSTAAERAAAWRTLEHEPPRCYDCLVSSGEPCKALRGVPIFVASRPGGPRLHQFHPDRLGCRTCGGVLGSVCPHPDSVAEAWKEHCRKMATREQREADQAELRAELLRQMRMRT